MFEVSKWSLRKFLFENVCWLSRLAAKDCFEKVPVWSLCKLLDAVGHVTYHMQKPLEGKPVRRRKTKKRNNSRGAVL